MTPMIDVVFSALIFLLTTANLNGNATRFDNQVRQKSAAARE
jgi:biopolymer transport protein ExbD